MHNCHQTRERLIDLLFRETEQAEGAALLADTEGCSGCIEHYRAMAESLHAFDRVAEAALPGEEFWAAYGERLRARLERAEAESQRRGAGLVSPFVGEYHLTMLEDRGLTARLAEELRQVARDSQLTWPEFKRDPFGFTSRTLTGYTALTWRFFSQRNVALATFSSFALLFLLVGGVIAIEGWNTKRLQLARDGVREDLEYLGMIDTAIPEEQPTPDPGPAGMAKGTGGGSKPKQEKPGGGGGGGRQEQLPASYGKLPPAQLMPQILPPNPRPPAIRNPSLPTPATIDADPALFPPDTRPIPYGDPKSTSSEISSGRGTGGGIGEGTGGGVGPGEGGGFGPGRGGNTGGGDRNEGGGGPGGGGGGTDYNRTFSMREVTRKAVLLHKPEPGFTEEARKNNVMGTVKLRMVLASSGAVTNISVIKGLPDGLTEKAIAAARQIRFQPAQKDGRAVSQWVVIEYNFNIY